jgi:hypothetical protein
MVFLMTLEIGSTESGVDEIGGFLAMCETSKIPLVKFGSCAKLYAFRETNRQMALPAGQ